VDQSVHLAAGDTAGIERLVQYMVRCPFSLSRLVKVTDKGTVSASCQPNPPLGFSLTRPRSCTVLPLMLGKQNSYL